LQDEKPQPLCQYAGKVLLVVNTASYCGFTRQYEGLEAMYAKYAAQGLVVLGFPSNDFQAGGRRPEEDRRRLLQTPTAYVSRCSPRSRCTGNGAHPLFAALAHTTGQAPSWNFNKYLVGRDGKAIAHFGSKVEPTSGTLVAAVEKGLGDPALTCVDVSKSADLARRGDETPSSTPNHPTHGVAP
jgi:glutathione peroxidase